MVDLQRLRRAKLLTSLLAVACIAVPACQSGSSDSQSTSVEIGSTETDNDAASNDEAAPDTGVESDTGAATATPAPTAVLTQPTVGAADTPHPEPTPIESETPESETPDSDVTSTPISFDPSPGVVRLAATADAPVAELAASFNEIGFELLRQQGATENTVLSSMSIGRTVLMARAAADQTTGAAIDAALSLPSGIAPHEAWNAIDAQIEESNAVEIGLDQLPSPTVTVAGRIWPSLSAQPEQGWIDLLAQFHGTDLSPIDVTEPELSRQHVNNWVADQTNDLIPELLPAGFIDPSTELVLTDAVYFKAQWKKVFGQTTPIEAPFTSLDGSTTPVTMLREFSPLGTRYAGDELDAAEVPYLGDDYSLLLIIPMVGGFEQVQAKLSQEFLATVDSRLEAGKFELLMPEWETDTSIDLMPWLTEIGAAPGDYPGIGPDTFVSAGVHGADIAVDDVGTIAAAATAIGFARSLPQQPDLTIAADRPFFYLIRHVDTGLVLFTGQVTDPLS